MAILRIGCLMGMICFLVSQLAEAQVNPRLVKRSPSKDSLIPDQKKIQPFDVQEYLSNLQRGTDSLIFSGGIDLKKRLSIVNEDTLSIVWAPTNQLVQVSEKTLIDSIWVTAYEYFASWDSKKIDIYDFNPKDFKDTIPVRLFDPYYGSLWSMPLKDSRVSSEFGFRRYRWHHGIDLRLSVGDSVFSAFDGIVRMASYDRYGYGHFVLVRHRNGLETLYGHLSKILVKVGEELVAGSVLGFGGNTGRSTGPHLHFEVRYKGLSIDPKNLYDFENHKIRSPLYTITSASFDHVIKMQEAVVHRVRSGENLSVIARKYGVSVSHITRMNNISTRTILRVGMRLKIR
ncbi:peptidoglycan DD-metalloendopeptidase family protein [Lunatimonas salinarum]|uniref:peptidoglycan DD-metalloendopeptidase family protein n=1 Tax=Lunatimonas salinarum TaxID=1774590 RepID=UPI001FD8302E|nr:peptidoglycan DD-metalloendopeptidase family protein [Lunatimonas salinarum]